MAIFINWYLIVTLDKIKPTKIFSAEQTKQRVGQISYRMSVGNCHQIEFPII